MALTKVMSQTILDEMLSCVQGRKVFVLDDFTKKIVCSVFSMKDILFSAKVVTTEHIHARFREAMNYPAVYFIEPTEMNIVRFLEDFNVRPPMYVNAHLFTTDAVPDELVERIQSSKFAVKSLQTFKEVNLSFIKYDDYVFNLDDRDSFRLLFDPVLKQQRFMCVEAIATQIASLLTTIGHYPSKIRYRKAGTDGNQLIAEQLKKNMSMFHVNNKEHSWNSTDCTVLIMDRGFDTVTPVMHDHTFEAMARDLLGIGVDAGDQHHTQNHYVYSVEINREGAQQEEKIAFLDDTNEFWTQIRHLNIRDAVAFMQDCLAAMKKQEQLSKDNLRGLELAKFHELMKKYPDQKKNKEAISGLSHLLQAAVDKYSKAKCELEQQLATNLAVNGRDNSGWEAIVKLLQQADDSDRKMSITAHEKLRFIYLYVRSRVHLQGVSMGDLKAALKAAKIPSSYLGIITNLPFLGVPVIRQDGMWSTYEDQNRDWTREKSVEGGPKDPVRPDAMPDFVKWCPNIYHFVKELIQFPNSRETDFPTIAMTAKPVLFSNNASSSSDDRAHLRRPSFIVFMLGGLTFGEAKFAKILTEKQAETGGNTLVLMGSTQLISPNDFLENMNSIKAIPSRPSTGSIGSKFSRKDLFQQQDGEFGDEEEPDYHELFKEPGEQSWGDKASGAYNDYCHNQ